MGFIIELGDREIGVLSKKKISTQIGEVRKKKNVLSKQSNIKKKGRNFAD